MTSTTSSTTEQIDILQCYSCGERHDNVELTRLSKPDHWTHWYACPETGDPCHVCIQEKKENAVELSKRVIGDFDKAYGIGRWLAAIFYFDNADSKVYSGINSSNWPHKEYDTAKKLLQAHAEKYGGLPEPTPLPRAAPIPGIPAGLMQQFSMKPKIEDRPLDEGSNQRTNEDATA